MDSYFPITYLSLLLFLLSIVGWFVIRQVFKTRKIEKNLSQLQQKVSQQKASAQEYYELGSIYLDKKLFSQATVQFQKALKCKDLVEEENKALVHNALGYAYVGLEQYDVAIRQYKEALKFYPDYAIAWNNLGFAYEKKKLTAQAIEAYEEALKFDPNNSTAKQRVKSLSKRIATPANN
ncbi:tetratricopeptide repeat protein [Oxynema sp. CENA135]|jgi:tetratricopeptide (TPR) repeat protein|uniref:Tetratricopeptide repeat protein n=1 Tax=Oxynema aestuarii AP17 TaxID=2064643 RepID=A0A6H1U1F0_9CYAN|nr:MULTISPECIES: tetratricopeptide repeat protein [Oxynema]MBK4731634.1 tetratricopeptide repeat protein [Oxynema sp. CENA135]QIZ72664.1 tetratricopeptide repeat protein [Oxynema aestuarii AP17]RMH73561.1 MAG: tetratricopeptide repeat protein [Cyanobacteria bacterium J007]